LHGWSSIRLEERYMEEQKKCCCHHGGEISDVEARVRTRTDEEYKKLLNRLNRIEGQIRGVKSMLENDAYCTDIVLQVSAINAALNSFNRQLLAEHIRTCVADDIRNGKDDTIEDLVNTVTRLMK
jgi:DNA-binding FrmR family transcriptional regulator